MVFCALCKESKESVYNWTLTEKLLDPSKARSFKICDECAGFLLRRMMKSVMGIRNDEELYVEKLMVSRTGVIEDVYLHPDNSLEITLNLDYTKAKRWYIREHEDVEEAETQLSEISR
jgi:hypothetical protein